MGRLLIIIGILLIIIGALLHYGIKLPIGRLPGDIRIENERFSFYFPITTSVLISLLLSLIFYLYDKLK
jgi:hypothetical protein